MSDQDQECKIKIKEVISLVRTPRGPSPVEPTHPALEAMDQSPQAEVVTLDDHDLNAWAGTLGGARTIWRMWLATASAQQSIS